MTDSFNRTMTYLDMLDQYGLDLDPEQKKLCQRTFDHEEIQHVRNAYSLCMTSNRVLRRVNAKIIDQNKDFTEVLTRCHTTAQLRLDQIDQCLNEMQGDQQCISDLNIDRIRMISFLGRNPIIAKITLAVGLIIAIQMSTLFYVLGRVFRWKHACQKIKEAVLKDWNALVAGFTACQTSVRGCCAIFRAINENHDND